MVVRFPTPFGLGQNGCWLFQKSQLLWALSFIFTICCLLNDRRRAAHSFFKIDRLFSLFLFSCPSLALFRLLILLLLLMSGNVHPNPGPIFPCSVRAENVIWQGKSVQCCTWLQMGPSKVLITFPLQIQSSWQLSLLKLPPYCNTVTPSLNSFDMYTSTVHSIPLSIDAALLPHPCLPTSYPSFAHSISSPSAPSPPSLASGCPSMPPASSSPPDSLRVL